MNNPINLKEKLSTLLNENPETFVETSNEVFAEEWLKDREDDFLMINAYNSNWVEVLRVKIENEIGEKYVKSPSKFSTLLGTFAEVEVIEKGTGEEKQKEIKNNPKSLEGIKEVVKHFDKEYGEG